MASTSLHSKGVRRAVEACTCRLNRGERRATREGRGATMSLALLSNSPPRRHSHTAMRSHRHTVTRSHVHAFTLSLSYLDTCPQLPYALHFHLVVFHSRPHAFEDKIKQRPSVHLFVAPQRCRAAPCLVRLRAGTIWVAPGVGRITADVGSSYLFALPAARTCVYV